MKKLLILALFITGCASHSKKDGDNLLSMQIVDRNGFSETVSVKERLDAYKKIDFSDPQPYQKVLRVFEKDTHQKNKSIITSYHTNGYLWQYLEILDGRAHGAYREYYPNHQLKIDVNVIEGMADIHEKAQSSWIFDGKSSVFDEDGHLVAEIFYEKGKLEGPSTYYYPNQTIKKTISYREDLEEGDYLIYDTNGFCTEKDSYHLGKKHGVSLSYWNEEHLRSKEDYEMGLLLAGIYLDQNGNTISEVTNGYGKQCIFKDNRLHSIVSYENGIPDGEVQIWNEKGALVSTYTIKNGQKNGEEWEYFLSTKPSAKNDPKLYILWLEGKILSVKTWYENGLLESQKEMSDNKKHGLSFAWYLDGNLMMIEEYDHNKLVKGSYFKKGEKTPFANIENGKGTAIIFDKEGRFSKKVLYESGKPVGEFY